MTATQTTTEQALFIGDVAERLGADRHFDGESWVLTAGDSRIVFCADGEDGWSWTTYELESEEWVPVTSDGAPMEHMDADGLVAAIRAL